MLKVNDLVVSYGGIEALKGISLEVPEGKIVTLIGANGAGKSTLLRSIIGLVKPDSGSITYGEKQLIGLNSQQIVENGITLVPEGRRVFPNLTVLENLQILQYSKVGEHATTLRNQSNAVFHDLLGIQTDKLLFTIGNGAAVRLYEADNAPQQGALTGAVGAD